MDEDELYRVANEKKVLLLLKQFHEHFCSKTPRYSKLSHFSEIKKDASMHREGERVNQHIKSHCHIHTPHGIL